MQLKSLWSTLRNLEFLDLSYNNFNHTDIGSALSGLSSLKSLDLENSGLSWRSISSTCYKSSSFVFCYFRKYFLTAYKLLDISKLNSLEVLYLGCNHLNEVESILSRSG
ncbi:hypothetical protein V8G54_029737 [Vigna mungo]|uniref:Uncharacterized protein n=1 Tax=Vigna mungo TaxID=3915 RepID=A0AAQ3RKL7_VIGMU